jgi:hypothetical protein
MNDILSYRVYINNLCCVIYSILKQVFEMTPYISQIGMEIFECTKVAQKVMPHIFLSFQNKDSNVKIEM